MSQWTRCSTRLDAWATRRQIRAPTSMAMMRRRSSSCWPASRSDATCRWRGAAAIDQTDCRCRLPVCGTPWLHDSPDCPRRSAADGTDALHAFVGPALVPAGFELRPQQWRRQHRHAVRTVRRLEQLQRCRGRRAGDSGCGCLGPAGARGTSDAGVRTSHADPASLPHGVGRRNTCRHVLNDPTTCVSSCGTSRASWRRSPRRWRGRESTSMRCCRIPGIRKTRSCSS